ncbi:MAG: RNA polymerase sporulation sigma factor SigH [Ruminococcaceae bacterium]|nr:RNA polymerase sporulation sigma factor SigH [Oscillospiraceae bacterium]
MDRLGGDKFCSMSDEEVVSLCQSGDEDALNHIIARYRNCVYSKANTYFLAGAEKEDLVQEGMIGLYKAVQEYKPDGASSFKSFAYLCVSRQILTAVKAAGRKKHLPLNSYVSLSETGGELDGEETHSISIEEKNPEDIVIGQESQSLLEVKVNAVLSKLELQVFMYYIEGMSYTEISDLVGKPVKSIDNALCRIKKKLTGALEEDIRL